MNDKLDLERAKQFRDLIIQPLLDNMDQRLSTHLEEQKKTLQEMVVSVNDHAARLGKLEGNQKKAMVGFGVYATGLSVAVGAFWSAIKSHFRWS